MYVVIRRADVGDVETLAVFDAEHEDQADELARLSNLRDNGADSDDDSVYFAYRTYVEFTPEQIEARKAFRDVFSEDA